MSGWITNWIRMKMDNINNMKTIEKYSAEIIMLILLIIVLSSCQTVKEIRGNTNNLRCTHVSR